MDVGLVVLEVEEVGEREPAADRRDAVMLDPDLERVFVTAEDREAVVGAPVVEVEDEVGDGMPVEVDRDDRRVLGGHPDVGDRARRGRRIGRDRVAHRADDRGPERRGRLGRDVAVAPRDAIGRQPVPVSVPSGATIAAFAFVVPTSIPSAATSITAGPYRAGRTAVIEVALDYAVAAPLSQMRKDGTRGARTAVVAPSHHRHQQCRRHPGCSPRCRRLVRCSASPVHRHHRSRRLPGAPGAAAVPLTVVPVTVSVPVPTWYAATL